MSGGHPMSQFHTRGGLNAHKLSGEGVGLYTAKRLQEKGSKWLR